VGASSQEGIEHVIKKKRHSAINLETESKWGKEKLSYRRRVWQGREQEWFILARQDNIKGLADIGTWPRAKPSS